MVQDDPTTGGRFSHCGLVAKIALDEPDLGHIGQVAEDPVGQIVEPDHLVTVGDQAPAQMRADEPRGAGDEDPHASQRTPEASPVIAERRWVRLRRMTPPVSKRSAGLSTTRASSTAACVVNTTTWSDIAVSVGGRDRTFWRENETFGFMTWGASDWAADG
jgi:hypothetical protein